MILGTFNKRTGHYAEMRSLTTEEIAQHIEFTQIVTEARNRLSLFRMLSRNYQEWRNFLNSMLNVSAPDRIDTMEELNRLLLNYLGAAYTIYEHFEGAFRRKFRGEDRASTHADFVEKLSTKYWNFGFILDYRGFAQHRGLAVGAYSRTPTLSSISIKITTHSKDLYSGREKDWKLSKLTADRGEIDLIDAVESFQRLCQEHYGKFVADAFFPDLVRADKFYLSLCVEAKKLDPESRMIFFTEPVKITPSSEGSINYSLKYLDPPNDVFGEVGIIVQR